VHVFQNESHNLESIALSVSLKA